MSLLIDISLPVYNGMWSYKPEWENTIEMFESTIAGGLSTVYKMELFSNTGTYIETSQHKLPNEKILNDLPLSSFYRRVKVIVSEEKNVITKKGIIDNLHRNNLSLQKGDAVIIANGYGLNHKEESYLKDSPSFESSLTDWLIEQELALLGVDTPIIENLTEPYQPVSKLFRANPELLLLAPLLIDPSKVKTGEYTLSCFPLNVEDTAVMLCRPVLITQFENKN